MTDSIPQGKATTVMDWDYCHQDPRAAADAIQQLRDALQSAQNQFEIIASGVGTNPSGNAPSWPDAKERAKMGSEAIRKVLKDTEQ